MCWGSSGGACGPHGFGGSFRAVLRRLGRVPGVVDLVITLVVVLVWMWRDGKAMQRNVWPYVLITLTAGVFGPLLYLLTRTTPARSGSAKVL